MSSILKIAGYIILFFSLHSCEKVIDFELKATDPIIVVEGIVSSNDSIASVNLSWSEDFYSTSAYKAIDQALVAVINESGEIYELNQTFPGTYQTNELPIEQNTEYRLLVNFGNKTYSAASHMPYVTPIDSIFYTYSAETLFAPEGYRAWIVFTDPETKGNCYRLQLFVNEERKTDGVFYLWDDKESNGVSVNFIFYMNSLDFNDQFNAELWAIDRPTYDYLKSLQAITSDPQGAQPSAPANPENNITNEALGYFTAVAVSHSKTLLIK
ncbi:MAG: DUF4249 domain-containing protein [Bacteroidales bacterium]|nr:DUF4249 domain-containing protein [Bacteroidales bacterium]